MPLGKSLGSILDDYFGEEQTNFNQKKPQSIQEIEIDKIETGPYQTRTEFDENKIKSLAQNILLEGLIQPIVVLEKEVKEEEELKYILLAGERRLRAVKFLKQTKILAVVRKNSSLSEGQQAMLSAMENLQREDLSPIELAKTFEMLIKTQNLTELKLAQILNVSEQYIKNYLRLLNLSTEVKEALLKKKLTEGQARYLVPLEKDIQVIVLQKILTENLTVKEIARLVQSLKESNKPKPILSPKLKKFSHPKASDILNKMERVLDLLPESSIMKCQGDAKKGKIVISWK